MSRHRRRRRAYVITVVVTCDKSWRYYIHLITAAVISDDDGDNNLSICPRTIEDAEIYKVEFPVKCAVDREKLQPEARSRQYCPLKKMHVTCTAWVESLSTQDNGQGGEHTDPVKNMNLYHCMTFFPLVAICLLFSL